MNKGFSLVVLTIIVTVMLILTVTVTVSIVNYQKNFKVLEFGEEISNIQEKVDLYYYEKKSYPIKNEQEVVTIELKNLDNNGKEQFKNEIVENSIKLKKLDLEKIYGENDNYTSQINNLVYGRNDLDENDVYLISITTGKVYYKAGVYGYYSLTDSLKKKINYTENTDNIDNYFGIVFSKSTDNYTNEPIITTIKIPSAYVVDSCKEISQDGKTSKEITLNENDDFKEGKTSGKINSNYKIVISWKENISATKTNITVYNVDNFDNEAPSIEIVGEKRTVYNNLTGENKYYYFIEYDDKLSGIDSIKYTELKIEAENDDKNLKVISSYMENNGININSKSIEIKSGTKWITIYAKDKVGNETYKYIDVEN